MSAPKVGDRVRVIAGQWTGWEGVVRGVLSRGIFLWVEITDDPDAGNVYVYERAIPAEDVEIVPLTPVRGPVGADEPTEAHAEGSDTNGAQNGGKR